ncbi:hypothetical protein OF846_002335 [Rhodotorula toruloides]|nr:hypothetical protein OF846_002335 [Rhodotorula toruloides]
MDDGRWDRMADKTVEELQNPYSVLADPLNTNLLIQFYHAVRHAPPRLYDLQAVLRQRVPAIDNLYATWPDTPPLYHVTQLIQGISPAPPPRQARHSVELGQLSCLKADPPANVPPRDPTAPSCPTVDYVVERSDFIERETGHTMHFAEVFRVCVKPMFVARSRRLGLAATSKLTARYYFIAQLIQAIEQISQTVRHSADTVSITLYGEYAQAFGDIRPRPRKINLTDVRCASFYFNSYVFITYHPSVMMASRHPVVRSLLLGRECAQDKLFRGINTPFDVLYFQRAFRLDIEVDELDNMVQELSLDLNNLPETLNTISRALSDYVAVHGNGMRGKPGPYRYRGLRGSGGSCSLAGKRQTVVSKGLAKSDTPLADVHVLYPLAMDSTEEMVGALQANGFELDDVVEPDEIKQVYLTALPSLRLRAAVVALGGSSLNDLLLDNVHVQQPTSASELLKLFEMGLSHDDLVKQLLDALSMTDQATASPPTFSVRATASTSSDRSDALLAPFDQPDFSQPDAVPSLLDQPDYCHPDSHAEALLPPFDQPDTLGHRSPSLLPTDLEAPDQQHVAERDMPVQPQIEFDDVSMPSKEESPVADGQPPVPADAPLPPKSRLLQCIDRPCDAAEEDRSAVRAPPAIQSTPARDKAPLPPPLAQDPVPSPSPTLPSPVLRKTQSNARLDVLLSPFLDLPPSPFLNRPPSPFLDRPPSPFLTSDIPGARAGNESSFLAPLRYDEDFGSESYAEPDSHFELDATMFDPPPSSQPLGNNEYAALKPHDLSRSAGVGHGGEIGEATTSSTGQVSVERAVRTGAAGDDELMEDWTDGSGVREDAAEEDMAVSSGEEDYLAFSSTKARLSSSPTPAKLLPASSASAKGRWLSADTTPSSRWPSTAAGFSYPPLPPITDPRMPVASTSSSPAGLQRQPHSLNDSYLPPQHWFASTSGPYPSRASPSAPPPPLGPQPYPTTPSWSSYSSHSASTFTPSAHVNPLPPPPRPRHRLPHPPPPPPPISSDHPCHAYGSLAPPLLPTRPIIPIEPEPLAPGQVTNYQGGGGYTDCSLLRVVSDTQGDPTQLLNIQALQNLLQEACGDHSHDVKVAFIAAAPFDPSRWVIVKLKFRTKEGWLDYHRNRRETAVLIVQEHNDKLIKSYRPAR